MLQLRATGCIGGTQEGGILSILDLPVESILASNLNPRKEFDESHLIELSESLSEDGQWDPIIVRQAGASYELIAGECRLRAAKKLGWKQIRCNVICAGDKEAHVLALKTNLLRRNLNMVEEGEAVADMLREFDLTQNELAQLLGKKQSWISRRLSIASRLCPEVRKCLKAGKITACHALALVDLTEEEQIEICDRAIGDKLSVRAVRRLVKARVRPRSRREIRAVFPGTGPMRITNGCMKNLIRQMKQSLGARIDVDEYTTKDGLVYIIRVNANRRSVLRRKDMPENHFESFDNAQEYAKSQGGYCSGLFTVEGSKYWICYVEACQDMGEQRRAPELEAY